MSPTAPDEPADLQGLRIDVLREAVRLYLALAYATDTLPDERHHHLRTSARECALPAHEASDPALA
jgi:hypothetical protein